MSELRYQAERIAAGRPDLEERLAAFVRRERLPGAAAGVVCGDGLAWLAGTGFAEVAARTPTDPAPPMPPVWAEGGLWSTVADLARWVSFQLAAYREPAPAARVLDAGSLREMHQPRYLADGRWTQAWGISWCGTRREEVTWIGHSGGIPGFTSTICFDPVTQVGAIMLVNGTSASAALGLELAALARELAPARPAAPALPRRRYLRAASRCWESTPGPAWAAGCCGWSGETGSLRSRRRKHPAGRSG